MLESSGSALTIGDETGELEVYFKSSEVKKPTFQQGKSVRIVGILVKSTKGLRPLPRYPEDLEFSSSKVLGSSDKLSEQHNDTPWKTVGGAVFIAGVVGYPFRKRFLNGTNPGKQLESRLMIQWRSELDLRHAALNKN